MKKLLCAILLCLTVLPLAACRSSGDAVETTTVAAVSVDLSKYVIIRSSYAPDRYSNLFADFRAGFVERTGLSEVDFHEDLIAPGVERYREKEYEIILGDSNREASAAFRDLDSKKYGVKLVDNKIVIWGASKVTLQLAAEHFLSMLTPGQTIISDFVDFEAEYYEKDYFPSLEGVTMYVLGDSYFRGSSLDPSLVWPALLADQYSMRFINYGINGSNMSDYNNEALHRNPMVTRCDLMSSTQADIIVVEGGRNDFTSNVPIGENTDTVTTTFKGAVRSILTKMREKYPNAMIVCTTVWNVNGINGIGNNNNDYGVAMAEVCADMGIPCFKAYDTDICPVDMTDSAFRSAYCTKPTDVSHLNAAGMELVLPVFEKFIGNEYDKFLASK